MFDNSDNIDINRIQSISLCSSAKRRAVCLTFAMLFVMTQTAFGQAIWDGTADVSWYNQSESEFTITTAEQLAGLAQLVNGGNNMNGKIITLDNNIALNNTINLQDWADNVPSNSWTAIGTQTTGRQFGGTFDGAGFVVSGIYINSRGLSSNGAHGLFGVVGESGTVKNICVTASHIAGNGVTGGLAGQNLGTIMSSCVTENVTLASNDIGGLVGWNFGTFANSCATVNVLGNGFYHGGLVGQNWNGTITNSYATGDVTGTGRGGSNVYFGGLVGQNHGSLSAITNSYATGNVTGTGSSNYSVYVGGLVGLNTTATSIDAVTNSYYNSETSGQNDDEGKGTPKTTAELKQQATYENWDFTDIWTIDAAINNGYPHLHANKPTSILSPNRVIPSVVQPKEETVSDNFASITSGVFTAGPNPITKHFGGISFFWEGRSIENAKLSIYDASGNFIRKISITDKSIGKFDRRKVGAWDLTDSKGRLVSQGNYVVKGTVSTRDGSKSKISTVIGVTR